jgi:hypothetical protein
MLLELQDYYKVNVINNAVVQKYEDGTVIVIETVKNTPNIANWARHIFTQGLKGIPKKHEIKAGHVVGSVGYTGETRLYEQLTADNNQPYRRRKAPREHHGGCLGSM